MFRCEILSLIAIVINSDTLLAVAFASQLPYFTFLKHSVQSSHSLVLCPQSSSFCIDPSWACDASSTASLSLLMPTSHSFPSTSLVPGSVPHILHWSTIGVRCVLLLIHISIGIWPILALIAVNITCSVVKPLKFRGGSSSPAGGGDGIALVAFVTSIFIIPAARWHPNIQFVICAIVAYRDVSVSSYNVCLLTQHFAGQMVEKNRIRNMRCCHADDQRQALGPQPVRSDPWLPREGYYTPIAGSSPVVCSRYSSNMYVCQQRQAR